MNESAEAKGNVVTVRVFPGDAPTLPTLPTLPTHLDPALQRLAGSPLSRSRTALAGGWTLLLPCQTQPQQRPTPKKACPGTNLEMAGERTLAGKRQVVRSTVIAAKNLSATPSAAHPTVVQLDPLAALSPPPPLAHPATASRLPLAGHLRRPADSVRRSACRTPSKSPDGVSHPSSAGCA